MIAAGNSQEACFMSLLKVFISGICSGALVGIGGAVCLSCDNKYVGAVLFSVALISICYLGTYLFTGKIGFLAEKFELKTLAQLGVGLVGNFAGATLFGLLAAYAKPQIREAAVMSCQSKLENDFLSAVCLGAMCGILMYVAVKVFKEFKNPIGVIFCIPVFILSGYEHSIADMFYFSAAHMINLDYLSFIAAVVIGNAIGAMAIAYLIRCSLPKKS